MSKKLKIASTFSSSCNDVSTMSATDLDNFIEALGYCGINGYEAEINQCVGLCKIARTDINILTTVAQPNTFKYRTKKRHRFFYAAMQANSEWFQTLIQYTNLDMLAALRDEKDYNLYHLVSSLWLVPPQCQRIPQRIKIVNILATRVSKLDINDEIPGSDTSPIVLVAEGGSQILVNEYLKYKDKIDFHRIYKYRNGNIINSLVYSSTIYDNTNKTIINLLRYLCENVPTLNIDQIDHVGNTPFMLAVVTGENSPELVELLLQYVPSRIDINYARSPTGDTALHYAIELKHIKIIRLLCRNPYTNLNLQNYEDLAPLMVAIELKKTDIVDELLLYVPDRVDVNTQDNEGFSPLMIACQKNHLRMVCKLCSIPSIDMNWKSQAGYTALMLASGKNIEIIQMLLQYVPTRININEQDNNGWTSLHWFIRGNKLDIVRLLCGNPYTNLNLQDIEGNTPISYAIKKEFVDIVGELLLYVPDRVDVNIQDNEGFSPLMIACQHNLLSMVRKLCSIPSINMNCKNMDGLTALMIVSQHNNFEIVQELLQHNDRLNINLKDNNGNTALHHAYYFCNQEIINLLISGGIDENIRNADGTIAEDIDTIEE